METMMLVLAVFSTLAGLLVVQVGVTALTRYVGAFKQDVRAEATRG